MSERTIDAEWDVIIVGGGPAGMSAALVLGRARKRVLVIDTQRPRHAVADGVHNLLTREGISPAELRKIGRAEISAFPTTRFLDDCVAEVDRTDPHTLHIQTTSGQRYSAPTLLLAVGVEDVHPDLPGYAAMWGASVHVCPYCHGWESRDKAIGVISHDPKMLHKALLLRGWSDDITLFTDGTQLDDEELARVARAGIALELGRVVALEGDGPKLHGLRLEDGRVIGREVLFVHPSQRPIPLVRALGLTMQDDAFILTDPTTRVTSDPRIWAAGDCTTPMQAVVAAMATGMEAAAHINATLTIGSLG